MATNKNQHFVPRVHLAPFTTPETEDAINLYNIDRDKVIPAAPVKHQCSRDYFYGRDDNLDSKIRGMEGEYGRAVRAVQTLGYELSDDEHQILINFWQLQYMRTEAASRRSVEMFTELGSTIGMKGSEFRMEIRGSVQLAMKTFFDTRYLMSDLRGCLLNNCTDTPFVTSDDPAIFANRWLTQIRPPIGRSFGLTSAGAMAYLPLTPTIAYLAYDPDVYSVSTKSGWLKVTDNTDVLAANELQYLNCRANLYIRESRHIPAIRSQFLEIASARSGPRHVIRYAIKDGEYDGGVRYRIVPRGFELGDTEAIFHSQTVHLAPRRWLRAMRWKTKGVAYALGPARTLVRASATMASPNLGYERIYIGIK